MAAGNLTCSDLTTRLRRHGPSGGRFGDLAKAFMVGVLALAPLACVPGEDEGRGAAEGASKHKAPPTEKITIAGTTYSLELALDDDARTKGMGGRTTLAPDAGMLFIFPDSQRRSFWMRDCTLDLDIIFVDPLGFVTAVHHMPAEPPRRPGETESAYLARLKNYPSVSPAQFAIEVRGGELKKLNVKPNDKIDADWRRLKKMVK